MHPPRLVRYALLCFSLSMQVAACGQTGDGRESLSQSSDETAIAKNGDAHRVMIEWRELAPMNEPRLAHAVAALDGLIYAMGGIGGRGDAVEVFQPQANRWSFKANLPINVDHGWAATALGRVFVGDGRSKRVFAYDPAQDRWSEVKQPRFAHGESPAVGVLGSRIYLAGGSGEGMQGNEVEVYEAKLGQWSTLPPMRCRRHHTAGGVINGQFHVVGGRPNVQRCHEAYDPATGKWTSKADMPTGREGVAAAVVGGRLFVIGGEGNPADPDFVFNNVEVYDAASDSWKALPAMPMGKHGIAAAVVGDTIYLPGGGRKARVMSRFDVYVPANVPANLK